MRSFALVFLLSLGFGVSAFAEQIVYSQSFSNYAPPATGKCSLKSFSVSEYDQGAEGLSGGVAESLRGTMVGTVVETSDSSCVHDYAVVQYIHGCVYNIQQNDKTGQFDRYFGTVIDDSNGVTIPFKFDEWTVDSVDRDPMYYSAPAKTAADSHRFDGQLYAKTPLHVDGTSAGLTADMKTIFNSKYRGIVGDLPTTPKQTFSFDLPAMGSWFGYPDGRNSVTNVSLEFKICLYRTVDVPLEGSPKSFDTPTDHGGPLQCIEWGSRDEFDFALKKFVSKKAIDSFCSTPVEALARRRRRPRSR